jgi:hypothetical protein
LPDEARRLTEALVRLADAQMALIAAGDWDGFLALVEERLTLSEQLDPLITGREDLRPLFEQVRAIDVAQTAAMQAAETEILQELAELRPQQVAMHAYFGGGSPAGEHESRFIDRRD